VLLIGFRFRADVWITAVANGWKATAPITASFGTLTSVIFVSKERDKQTYYFRNGLFYKILQKRCTFAIVGKLASIS